MTEEIARLIRGLIEAELEAEEFTRAEVAERIIAKLRRDHPGAYDDWIAEQARSTMVRFIGEVHRNARAAAMNLRPFAKMRRTIDSGEPAPRLMDLPFQVDDDGRMVPIRNMTGRDHLYVAESYHSAAEPLLMREAFHRALAKRVGSRKTGDVLTEEQCQRILGNVTTATGRVA